MTAHIYDPPVGVPWLPDFARQIERQIDAGFEVCTVSTLPPPVAPYRFIFVTDETGGPTPATNNGTNWLRFPDGAVVS